MCKAFQHIESNERQRISYKVTNDCIAIWVDYEKSSDWVVLRGKIFLQWLLHHYKLHLPGYDPSKFAIVSFNRLLEKKNKTLEYKFPLSLERFDLRIFHNDVVYLNYDAINFNNYDKLFWLKKWSEKMIEFLMCLCFARNESNENVRISYSVTNSESVDVYVVFTYLKNWNKGRCAFILRELIKQFKF